MAQQISVNSATGNIQIQISRGAIGPSTTANVANTALNLNAASTANVIIGGGTANYVLSTDGAGNTSWVAQTGGGTYGDSNVVTLMGAFGSNTISTTGLITANGGGLSNIVGANITGEVSFAAEANSVAVANVVGIGNIATTNYDGNAVNVLHGDGTWSADATDYSNSNVVSLMASFGSNTISTTGLITGNGGGLSNIVGANVTGAVANATLADFATTANAVAGANVSGEVAFSATANAVAGANVSGVVANATHSTISDSANSVAVANVSGIGNIATVNLDGNTANYLGGTGVWGPVAGGTTPAGADTYVQYNNAGAFGANSTFNFTNTGRLNVGVADTISANNQGGIVATSRLLATNTMDGNTYSLQTISTLNDATSDFKLWKQTITDTFSGANTKFVDLIRNSTSQFSVGKTGNIDFTGVITGDGGGLSNIAGANVTGLSISSISNGTSNVDIATVNGNVTIGVAGTANIAQFTTLGSNIVGDLNVTDSINANTFSASSGNIATYNTAVSPITIGGVDYYHVSNANTIQSGGVVTGVNGEIQASVLKNAIRQENAPNWETVDHANIYKQSFLAVDSNNKAYTGGEISVRQVQGLRGTTIVSSDSTTNEFTCSGTGNPTEVLQQDAGQVGEVVFTGTTFGGIVAGTTYYIVNVVDQTHFQISATEAGPVLALTSGTGTMIANDKDTVQTGYTVKFSGFNSEGTATDPTGLTDVRLMMNPPNTFYNGVVNSGLALIDGQIASSGNDTPSARYTYAQEQYGDHGMAMKRANGDGLNREPVIAGDRIGKLAWAGATWNPPGTNLAFRSLPAFITGKIDASFTGANGERPLQGIEFGVVSGTGTNSSSTTTHNMYANGEVSFSGPLISQSLSTGTGNINVGNIIASGTIVSGNITHTAHNYGQFENNATVAFVTNTVENIQVSQIIANNISVVSGSQITVANAGTYAVSVDFAAVNADTAEHVLDAWFAINGVDIPNSTHSYEITKTTGAVTPRINRSFNDLLQFSAGDYLELRMAADNFNVSLNALASQASPYPRPASSSVVIDLHYIGT